MTLPSFRNLLISFTVCALVIVLCVRFVDLPVALFVNAHVGPNKAVASALDIVLLFIPLSAAVLLVGGCVSLAGRALPRWAIALTTAGFSLMWASACNFFLLQPFFGRMDFKGWLVAKLYGFYWFQGHGGAGFPSGHMTIVASYLLVFWFFYPRARVLLAALIALEAVGVVALNWHFVSDAIGGFVVGATAAVMTTAMLAPHFPPQRGGGGA